MEAFLRATSAYSPEEVEERTGVNRESVRKYRRGEWKRLEAKTKRRMLDYLEALPARSESYADGVRYAVRQMAGELRRLSELSGDQELADALEEHLMPPPGAADGEAGGGPGSA